MLIFIASVGNENMKYERTISWGSKTEVKHIIKLKMEEVTVTKC